MVKPTTNVPSSIEFFKVFLSSVSSRQLSLPPAFVMQLNRPLLKKATLKDHNGKLWDVQLEKTERDLIIRKGWQEFASHHSLVDADFLVFKYDGNSQFYVKLYGKNGLEKEKTLPNNMSSTHMEESETETEDEKNRSHSISGCKRKYSNTASIENQKQGRSGGSRSKLRQAAGSSRGRRSKLRQAAGSSRGSQSKLRQATGSFRGRIHKLRQNTVTRNGEYKMARAYVTPQNPHFVTIMSRSTQYVVHVHKSVVKQHNLKLQETMTLCDENGQSWPVNLIFRDDGRIHINEGWRNFHRKHKLAIGDMCIFEFMPTEDDICDVLQVQIVRKNGEFDVGEA
ncbi:hypothetical protein P3X46_018856 [Hevea brasiliensis]|uniref:TF-B3 domain-containing protein n=1 Tax=Hevea brasiliensis TaxID=3981 RepID=A0ABQ9LRZ5_HEVBR|nr:putative B3 domain-containing protein At5g66980 [Hevea brasiliensis]KAJ9170776.1 hypothetical protein P3X46_018856 [Hevea brasiliensis]